MHFIISISLLVVFSSFGIVIGNVIQDQMIVTVAPINITAVNFTHIRIFNGTPYDSGLTSRRILKVDKPNTLLYSCDIHVSSEILYIFDARTASIEYITNIMSDIVDSDLFVFHAGVSPSMFLKIAIDWISSNVYWVDPLHQWIAVQPGTNPLDDQVLYEVLIDEDLVHPTALALDPFAGYLFWSNRRSSITIERSTLHGTDRQRIITRGLGYPCAIAVDFEGSEIYWVDFIRDTIERADYNGGNRKTIIRLSHTFFFDIALYQNSMIVTEKDYNRLIFLNKITGTIDSIHTRENDKFLGVSMYSSLNQPGNFVYDGNACAIMNCGDICIGGGTNNAVCMCRTGYELQSDGRTCTEVEGKYYRAVVISDTTRICRITSQIVTHSGLYRCIVNITSGENDDVIKYIDVDANARDFFYATTYSIYKIDINFNRQTLTTSPTAITGLSLDWTNGNLYWSSGTLNGDINVLTWQGTRFLTTSSYPRNILVDPHSQKLYWISGTSGTNVIMTSDLEGRSQSTVVTSGQLDDPKSLVIDHQGQRLYWVDEGYARRSYVNGTGLERIDFASGTAFTNPDLLAVYKEYLLWTEDLTLTFSRIHMVSKTSPFQTVNRLDADFLGRLTNIKIMDPALQKRENGPCNILNGGCEHICIPNGGTRHCLCEFGFQLDSNGQNCNTDTLFDNFLLVSDWTHNKIYQVSLETGDVYGLKTGSIGSPVGVAYDHVRNHVIWGETSDDLVRIFDLGTSQSSIVSKTVQTYAENDSCFLYNVHPDRFAIEYTSGNIYYTAVPLGSGGFAGVAVVSPNGKHRKLLEGGQYPRAIVLDPTEGIMLWTDYGDEKVWKAYMDGSGKSELYVSPNMRLPNGIAIDHQEKVVYITDGYTNNIHRCTYITQTTCSLVHQDQDAWLMSIFLSGEFLYYTSWNNPFITRIDKATFTNKTRISNNPELGRLDDVFVYESSEPKPAGHSVCSKNGGLGPCSTFCLPKGRNEYTCTCEDGINLVNDGHRCENVNPTTSPVTTSTTTTSTTTTTTTSTSTSPTTPTFTPITSRLSTPSSSTRSSTAERATESTTTSTTSSGPNIAIIAAAGGGGVFVLVLVIIGIVCCCRRSNQKKKPQQSILQNEVNSANDRPASDIYDVINGDLINLNTLDNKKDETRTRSDVRNTNDYTSPGQFEGFAGYERLRNVHRDNEGQFDNRAFAPEIPTVAGSIPERDRSRRSTSGKDQFTSSRDKNYYYADSPYKNDQLGGSSTNSGSLYGNDPFRGSNLRDDRSVGSVPRSDQYIDWTDQVSGVVPMRAPNPIYDQQMPADYIDLNARESTGDYLRPRQANN